MNDMTPAGPGRLTRFDPPADPVLRVGAVQHVPQVGLVEIVLGAADTGGVFDVVDALIEPGGSWAAHRHAFAEWFRVLHGELELLAPRAGQLRPVARIKTGQTCAVPPWSPHALSNAAASPARFLVIGQPGVMSRYFADFGVHAPGDQRAPRGPRALAQLTARYDIELITAGPAVPAAAESARRHHQAHHHPDHISEC
jgi:quercetin dioxygenase-like cupin family protein